jgi:hypothetical protein
MPTIIGHAVGNELGTATGGKPGNQNGKELCFQNYYTRPEGWNLVRAKDPKVAAKIAAAMTACVNNKNIGYCQTTRNTLYNELVKIGFDKIAELKTPVNTDCSASIRVCVKVAGIEVPNFNTSNELSVLLATGAFDHIKTSWSEKDLRDGDILVTKSKGHTCVVTTGMAAVAPAPVTPAPTPATPAPAPTPPVPAGSGKVPKIGDTVYFNGGAHYSNANALVAASLTRKAGYAQITNVKAGTKYPYHLIGKQADAPTGKSDVHGWVSASQVKTL